MRVGLTALLPLVALLGCQRAMGMETATPDEMGMDKTKLDLITKVRRLCVTFPRGPRPRRQIPPPPSLPTSLPPASLTPSPLCLECVQQLDAMVKKGEIAGAAYVVARGGRYVHHGEVGYMDLETSTPFRLDTICRLLSMTKVTTHHTPHASP